MTATPMTEPELTLRPGWYTYLNQSELWKPNGKPLVRIADMSPEWRFNASQWLLHRTKVISHKYIMSCWAEQLQAERLDSVLGELDRGMGRADRDLRAWLKDMSLFRALVAGLPNEGGPRRRLAERARHWSTCPMRLTDAICDCQPTAHK